MLRQAGKSSERSDDVSVPPRSRGSSCPEPGAASLPTAPAAVTPANILSSATFAKRFEVLFCGRVSVPHKNAPPALIDECILKLGHWHSSESSMREGDTLGSRDGLKALAVPSNGLKSRDEHAAPAGRPTTKPPVLFQREPSSPCLQALDENGLSPEISQTTTTDSLIRPSSQQENRTMLFMVIFITHTHTTVIDL